MRNNSLDNIVEMYRKGYTLSNNIPKYDMSQGISGLTRQLNMTHLESRTTCGSASFQRVYDYVKSRLIVTVGLPEYDINTVQISKKWYQTEEGVIYSDDTSDSAHTYIIAVVILGSQQPGCEGKCKGQPIKYCFDDCPDGTINACVAALRFAKDGSISDDQVPNNIIDEAMKTLPTISITNFAIGLVAVGGVLFLALMMSGGKKK